MPGDAVAVGQWETFYVIVGSSGGALTGLLFVVVALTVDRVRAGTTQGLSAFISPSVFHFCNVLFVSAMIVMPRRSLTSLGITLGLCALVGGFITVVAAWRIARFDKYQPVAEDWIWHAIIPCVSYVGLLVAAIILPSATDCASVLVAEENDEVLGYVYAGVEGRDYMSLRGPAGVLYDIVVDPNHRRGGVGRALLQAALGFLKSHGSPRVVLSTATNNEAAQRLFEQAGFRRTMVEMTAELGD